MKVRLANGQLATIVNSLPVYKTDNGEEAWVDLKGHSRGLAIYLADDKVEPITPLPGLNLRKDMYDFLVENPNKDYGDDYPVGSNKESLFRTTVYTIELEDDHTCFVDRLGIWVHT